jgi:Flp pilus assembly protein TadB
VGVRDLFRGKLLWASATATVGVFAVVLGLWLMRGDAFEQRVAKLQVGLPMLDAMRVMGDDNMPAPQKTKFNLTLGCKSGQDDQNRFPTSTSR